ncbi:O-antigen ligase family protein [Desulfohalobium retbaense]|uniref:O-antigen ligase family protein n=1 Tax=Desulfohalobium retbaense TaxID=45663 RepID=UPI001427C000|nr:O-antigen ligase family protein [Desulfohalobium retbaense]
MSIDFKIDKVIALNTSLLFVFLIISTIRNDIDAILESFMFFGGIMGYWTLTKVVNFNIPIFLKLSLYVLLPISIISALIFTQQVQGLSLFAFTGDQWRVYIVSIANTKRLANFLLLSGLFYFLSYRNKVTYNTYLSLFSISLGLYLSIFSGSRTNFIIVIILPIILLTIKTFFARLKRYRYVLLLLPFIIIAFIYSTTLYIEYNNVKLPGFAGELTKTTSDHGEVGAGRIWLWYYHLDLFKDNYLTGVSADKVDFKKGDMINGTRARAGGESYWTISLARYGVFSFLFYISLLYFGYLGIKYKSIESTVLYFVGIILNTTMADIGQTYGLNSILFFLLWFSSLHFHMNAKY